MNIHRLYPLKVEVIKLLMKHKDCFEGARHEELLAALEKAETPREVQQIWKTAGDVLPTDPECTGLQNMFDALGEGD